MFGFNPLYAAVLLSISGPQPSFSVDFTIGTLRPDLTFSRASNATMFDSQGRLVWAPHNVLTNGSGFGGTPSTAPTGWQLSIGGVPGGTTSVVGQRIVGDVIYTQVRFQGTGDATLRYPFAASVTGASAPGGLVGDAFTGSFTAALVSDAIGNAASLALRIELQDLTAAGAYVSSSSLNISSLISTTPARFTHARILSGASTSRINVTFGVTIPISTVFDFTVELGAFQLERTGVDSPKPYVSTTTAAAYGPRFDYNPATLAALGLLIEESRTNSCANSGMVGGVAPSTFPTGWNVTAVVGITTTYAYGTELGIPYIDVTYSGSNTSGAAAFPTIFLGTTSGAVSASNGQTWNSSVYVRKIAGSGVLSNWNHNLRGRASGVLVSGQNSTGVLTDTSPLTAARATRVFTFTDATITHVEHVISISLAIAEAIDITIRIGGPQLEQGAFATSLIPTFGVAATRALETCTCSTAGWYNTSEGTVVTSWAMRAAGGSQMVFSLDDGTTSNRLYLTNSGVQRSFINSISGVDQGTVSVNNAPTPLVFVKAAARYKVNDFRMAVAGTLSTNDLIGSVTAGITVLRLGASASGAVSAVLNGWISSFSYYNTALPDAKLQELTA